MSIMVAVWYDVKEEVYLFTLAVAVIIEIVIVDFHFRLFRYASKEENTGEDLSLHHLQV